MPHDSLRMAAVLRIARHVQRPRVGDALVCAALTLLALLQQPGRIVADTKIDMAVNPVGFLGRVLHLWDPTGSFGQVQNQAYGYLWPMGPFFMLGTGIGLPAWMVQRLWWALLLCVAYLGVVRLAERLGIGTPVSRLVAGVAFALTPRIITQIGAISAEAWPTAVAPWVLIPLIGLAKGASIRRGVALSALAVACAGGINATAVIAVLPLGFLWLLTITPVRRRVRACVAWCAAVLAATAWWVVPLLLLGRYSPPFEDFVERASTTTGITDPVDVLRGANYWLAYLHDSYRPWLPAGWEIATNDLLFVPTVVLAAVGLTGLTRRGVPHRRFLVTGFLVGFTLVGMGHVAQLPGTFAGSVRELLDGIASPLRNVHKFDVVLRLPLTMGVAHLLGVLLRARAAGRMASIDAAIHAHTSTRARLTLARIEGWGRRRLGVLATWGTAVMVLVTAGPALVGLLPAAGGFSSVPGYWRDAATWLNDRDDDGRVLVIPGTNFPNYTWGDTLDEITQPLLTGETAVRSVIPMSPANTIRMMDAIESVLTSGSGSPALADYLARAGVSYVLVRNDLNYGESGAAAPVVVQQALSRSPGLVPAATFGPPIQLSASGGEPDKLGSGIPALQILRVDRTVDRVVTYPADQVATVVGGPESLLWLAEAGLLPAGPTILAGDLATASPGGALGRGPLFVTDGLRRRDVSFGSGRDASSTTLTASESHNAHDYLPAWGPQWTTPAAYTGVEEIRASTSWAYKNPTGTSRPEHQPYAAVDGDPSTSWQPELYTVKEGQWLEVTLAGAQPVPEVTVRFDDSAGGRVTRVTVDTGNDRATVDVTGPSVTVPLGGGTPVERVRLTIEGFVETTQFGLFGISELEIPGVTAGRTLLVPAAPGAAAGSPASVVLTAAPSVPECYVGDGVDGVVHCTGRVARGSEDGLVLDRTLTLAAPTAYRATVWARARAGAALNAVLDALVGGPAVTASSMSFNEPMARPGAVVDGEPGTTWWAGADDPAPELHLIWPAPQTLTGLRVSLGDGALATPVAAVTVIAGGTEITGTLDERGELRFDTPLRTAQLTLRLVPGPTARGFDPYVNKVDALPLGISELTLLGAEPPAFDPDTAVDLPCGSGPTLTVGGQTVTTRLSATARDLVEQRQVPAVPCAAESTSDGAAVDLGAGAVRAVASASDLAAATRVALRPAATAATPPSGPETVPVHEWSGNRRLVTVGPHTGDLVLVVRENTNPGWVASIDGVELMPLVMDGWQQGWIVPAGLDGQVELRFAPDSEYRTGLVVGAALVLLVVLLAVVPPRRPAQRRPAPRPGPRTGLPLLLVAGVACLAITAGVLGGLIILAGLGAVAYREAVACGAIQPRLGPSSPSGWRAIVERLIRRTWWLVPAALLLMAGAVFAVLYEPWLDWVPQMLGLLAIGSMWLHAVVTTAGSSAAASRRSVSARST